METINGRPTVEGKDLSRVILIERVRMSKLLLVSHLEAGERDWNRIRMEFDAYQNLQMAADLLGEA